MKLAVITLTNQGEKLARELALGLENNPTILRVDLYHKNVRQTLNDIFLNYDCILGIMAIGIMVRSICNLISDKTKDPAILVMDENGKYVISLLSGHLGGGNDYAVKIADIMGTEPVITTSTDVNCKLGVDSLARKYFLKINPTSEILIINKALIENKKVILAVPAGFNYLFNEKLVKNAYHMIKSSKNLKASFNESTIKLTPKKLVVGLGSRRGVSTDQVLFAVNEACKLLEIPPERIDCLATAEPKMDEQGIKDAAIKLAVPLKVVSLDATRNLNHPDVTESPFVKKTFGIPGICEPAALIAAGEQADLIFKKTKFDKVTVAVAVSRD